MLPAIFLDRDGVIIENRSNYVRDWADVEFFQTAVQALAQYSYSPYRFILVTNQSAVGKGIISLQSAQNINNQIVAELEKNGCRIDKVFMCPHTPEDLCSCRKPLPGMLFDAAHSMKIELSRSIMIGDAWTDLLAGQAAGVAKVGLVLTGRGRQQLKLIRPPELSRALAYSDLAEALEVMLPIY